MDWIVILSGSMKLAFAAVAVLMLVQLLGLFDQRIAARIKAGEETPFLKAWTGMLAEPRAVAMYLGLRILACAHLIGMVMAMLLLAIVIAPRGATAAPMFAKTYDRAIERAAAAYLPGVPWRLYKAQLYQESRLDPAARSPAGAEGLAQFMPETWAEISRAMGVQVVDRRLAEPSIQAAAYYMARLRGQWRGAHIAGGRPERDRHDLALASYNAGIGHILAAQRLCGDASLYEPIMACLPRVTGRHAAETLGYAPAIRRWHAAMEAQR